MQKITRALNIEQGEGIQISLILLQSFFIGTFMATFDVTANALFFTSFGGDDLGQAYAFSAVLGMLFTYVYIKLQSKVAFTKLAIFNLVFIAVLTVSMWLSFNYSQSKWLIYGVFLLQGPLNTLAIVGFWGLMGRVFNLRQGKRLFGLVDSGQILGMILILFSVPFIRSILPDTEDLLIISSIGILFSVFMQVIISNKYKNQILSTSSDTKTTDNVKQGISLIQIMKNPYMMMMVIFVVMAMLAQFFAHYSFLVVANTKYPNAGEFASFLAVFMGTLMVFTFAFKTFVFGKLMEMYGLKVNLLILPILLIFFTVLASVSGSIFGYTIESSGFQMFFLFIAISKLFAQSLRMAIEVPAFKLLYQPLDSNIKYDVQAKIDGTINEFSALLGGLVLMGLSLISFVTLIDYSYVLALIIGAYIYVAFKLYQRYRDTLHETLNSFKGKFKGNKEHVGIDQLLNNIFKNKNDKKAISILKICKEIEPVLFEEKLEKALGQNNNDLKKFAVSNVGEFGLSRYQNEIEKIALSTKDEQTHLVLDQISIANITQDKKLISKHLRSKNPIDKILLINEVIINKKPNVSVIAELLKDPNIKVKNSAISAVGKIKEITLLPSIIEFIDNPNHKNTVSEVLLSFGDQMLELLDIAFYKSNFDSNTLVQIISIYEKCKVEKAVPILLKKLTYPDQKVVNRALIALKSYDFKAISNDIIKVQQSIEIEIGIALWNMVALEEAQVHQLPDYLINALRHEKEESIDHVYTLLSLIYDQKSISNIRENIESGTSEGVGFAIELLDLFVAEELKPKLFPIFDDLDIDERIYRLELFYPIQRLEKKELIIQIINRDYNYINNWTKSCALFSLIESEDKVEITDDFIAQLFNFEPLLYQTSAWLINKNNHELYQQVVSRVYPEKRALLDEFIPKKAKGIELLYFEKALFLTSNLWLNKLKGELLGKLCTSLRIVKVETLNEFNELIDNYPLAIIKEGKIEFNGVEVEKGDIITDLVKDAKKDIIIKEKSEIYIVEKDKFYELLYLHNDFLNLIFEIIDVYHSREKTEA